MRFGLIFCVALIYLASVGAQNAGDLGPETKVTNQIISDTTQLQWQIEDMAGVSKFEMFRAETFRKQTVTDGYEFFIKIRVAFYDYIHVRIHKDLSSKITLISVLVGKTKDDPIQYF